MALFCFSDALAYPLGKKRIFALIPMVDLTVSYASFCVQNMRDLPKLDLPELETVGYITITVRTVLSFLPFAR